MTTWRRPFNMECPDAHLKGRHKYNFCVDRCVERFRMAFVFKDNGCYKCDIGRHWAIQKMMERR